MATKKRRSQRQPDTEPAPAGIPQVTHFDADAERAARQPSPKPPVKPEPRVSVFIADGLDDDQQRALRACERFVFVSERDATCSAHKRHARVWAVAEGVSPRPRPNGTRIAWVAPGDDPVAKVLEAAEL